MTGVVVVGNGMAATRLVEELLAADRPTPPSRSSATSRTRRTTGCCCRGWSPVQATRGAWDRRPPHRRVEALTGVAAVDVDRVQRVVLDDRWPSTPMMTWCW